MHNAQEEKIIIVEGTSDKRKIANIIKDDDIEIICTNGTISLSRLDEIIEELSGKEVFILADSDEAGEKLRKQFKREFPEAKHLYIDKMYREVASAPDQHLATVLLAANIDVHTDFLDKG